ncbi:unnamed protein product [Camellia sinensis]
MGRIEAQTRRIPNDETVEALGEIAEQLGKKGWNSNLKHCDENLTWQTPRVDSSLMYDCTVNCTCLSDDECHISAIELEASGFEGPIPSDISLSHNLTELRISDLNGGASKFPPLGNMKAMTKLMLRNYDLCSLHINCGGGKAIIKNTIYEADDEYQGGPAKFVQAGPSSVWGFSNTGHFWDASRNASYYIAKNVSVLTMNYSQLYTRDLTKNYSQMFTRAITMDYSQLYTRARVSPLFLTYHGRCLENGSHTVTLHFAEIIFRDNRTFQSLGRRIFDVYIQDELGQRDNSYFKPPDQKKKIFIVVGALAFAICLVFMILFILWWKCFPRSITSREQEWAPKYLAKKQSRCFDDKMMQLNISTCSSAALRGLELQTGLFAFRQIKAATNNFDDNNKIGEGGFRSVYKGILLDGTVIAVKQLSSKSKQGNREFVNEIGMISGLQHPYLVRLYGCCIEGNQLLLVYEYMENNSLAELWECQLKLDWPSRLSICIGIARGLATNVLLDGNLNPKISDFGLAKLTEDENTHISTRIAGTIGYMAPEYALWGILTHKADVYSFGVVTLEIVTGKNNMKYHPSENYVGLLDW